MDPADRQVEADKRVIEQLMKHGDDGSIPRDVDHYAYFPTLDGAQHFVNWLNENGCTVPNTEPRDCEDMFGVSFVCHTPADLESISAKTVSFYEKAEELGGEYDGWGCEIQRIETPKKGFLRRLLGG